MNSTLVRRLSRCAWFVCAVALTGCEPSQDAAPQPKSTTPAAHLTTANVEQLRAKLEKADAADGKVDHAVSKCAGCRLAMDGDAAYPVEIEGYTLRLCGESCQQRFKKDAVNAVLEMKLPETSH